MTLQRFRNTVLFVAATALGAASPGLGCNEPCPEELPEGMYRVEGDVAGWRAGSGQIEVTETRMHVAYVTTDGSAWEVEYIRVPDPY
ncbi:hypothetical protein [Nannocystis bainbridge]|uniref:Secreted protein n=1 Tax=Nannocystis bainbridge TaxID=2995303 RepID=A0ABT5DT77_9BACT|nr:hypothetical protein [Nannocystis bainbridge]MDC0716736.1 hypothetical protein [Nannocystis bainbridge]